MLDQNQQQHQRLEATARLLRSLAARGADEKIQCTTAAAGAGVGKGRTIAGLVLENWRCGRRRHLWLTIGSDLRIDSRRDLDDVGAGAVPLHPLNKLPYGPLDSDKASGRPSLFALKPNATLQTVKSVTGTSYRLPACMQCSHPTHFILSGSIGVNWSHAAWSTIAL